MYFVSLVSCDGTFTTSYNIKCGESGVTGEPDDASQTCTYNCVYGVICLIYNTLHTRLRVGGIRKGAYVTPFVYSGLLLKKISQSLQGAGWGCGPQVERCKKSLCHVVHDADQ